MTPKEFNEKYKDNLEKGHYGLVIPDARVVLFLDDIFTDLVKIPGFQYSQIKSKFGCARVYTNLKSAKLEGLIEKRIDEILNTKIR